MNNHKGDTMTHGGDELITASPKLAAVVASATTGVGVASWFEIISGGLAIVASIAGIILTVVMIRATLARRREEAEKMRAELNGLQLENRIRREELRRLGVRSE